MYFRINKKAPGQYWWVAKGNNNETLCASEILNSKASCHNAIRVLKAGASGGSVQDNTGE